MQTLLQTNQFKYPDKKNGYAFHLYHTEIHLENFKSLMIFNVPVRK